MSEPINWHSLGYSKAMLDLTSSAVMTETLYPTRDRFSERDERDFIAGYNEAISDYQNKGFNSVMAYASEKET